MMTDDAKLLREFSQLGAEEAFAAVVSRYINLVYSVSLRQVRDIHLAEEVTQSVFIILAQKAGSLNPKTILSGWLCRTARNASANALKIQRRRQAREQQYMQSRPTQTNEPGAEPWTQLEPLLDSAMAQLGRREHDALVMRFFEGRSFRDVGIALGTSEAAAKMRVNRALGKMRQLLAKRGLAISAAVIAGAVSSNSVQAAPLGLATSVMAAAVKGTAVTASTLTITKITLKIMAYTKLKTAVAVGALALCVAGGAGLVAQHVRADGSNRVGEAAGPMFAGFATPEAALKSFVWSESTGDVGKLLAACTAEQGERFKKKIDAMSQDEIRQRLMEEARNRANYEITDKEVISGKEVRLHLRVQPYPGHPNVGNDVQVMRKIGKEWKYAGKYGVDIKE